MSVLITGRAIATSLGTDPEQTLDGLLAGRVGVETFEHPDAARLRTTLGFPFPDDGRDDEPFLRSSRWVTRMIGDALADAGITADDLAGRRIVVVVGSGQRELNSVEKWAVGRTPAPDTDELSYRRAVVDALGPVPMYSVLGACAAGLLAVGLGVDLLDEDEADLVVAVGIEPVNITVSAMHDRVSVAMTDRIRPFDAHRVGTIFGEGAAAVVLQFAREDGPTTGVAIRGVGFSSDARRSTAPDVDGIVAAMTDAHRRAGVSGSDIDLVLAHGTGTARNDEAEAEALTSMGCVNAFVTSVKPSTGHTLASSGLVSLVLAVGCLRRGAVPPTLHLDELDESASTLNVPREPVEADLRIAQIDAFGFGGINAVAIVERLP